MRARPHRRGLRPGPGPGGPPESATSAAGQERASGVVVGFRLQRPAGSAKGNGSAFRRGRFQPHAGACGPGLWSGSVPRPGDPVSHQREDGPKAVIEPKIGRGRRTPRILFFAIPGSAGARQKKKNVAPGNRQPPARAIGMKPTAAAVHHGSFFCARADRSGCRPIMPGGRARLALAKRRPGGQGHRLLVYGARKCSASAPLPHTAALAHSGDIGPWPKIAKKKTPGEQRISRPSIFAVLRTREERTSALAIVEPDLWVISPGPSKAASHRKSPLRNAGQDAGVVLISSASIVLSLPDLRA